MSSHTSISDPTLDKPQRDTFGYFLDRRFFDYTARGVLMRRCAPLTIGLRRAGFTGGWLS